MPALVDLTGKRFGRLVVKCRAHDHIQENGRKRIRWKCLCDCGNEIVTNGDALKTGKTSSCGCLMHELMLNKFATHHETNTKLYGVWCAIKRRCYNKNSAYYENYGGRGITMCDDWRDNYETFRNWANENGYAEGLTIDRIDNNSGYLPENCRWVNYVSQANNRRSNINIIYNGKSHTLTEWADLIGVNRKTMFSRYYSGWSVEKMLTTY